MSTLNREKTKVLDQYISKRFSCYLGDNCEVIDGIPDNAIGLTVTSVPFPGMYAYSNSERDIGNTKDINQMLDHYRYLASSSKLGRVTKPGRSVCIHLTNVPLFKHSDGVVGRMDFRGDIIRLMQAEGWIYTSEVTIEKDPQVRAQRTKDRGLLFKTLASDASLMSPVMPDYLVVFRKRGQNTEPIRAGKSVKYGNPNGWMTNDEWIEIASAIWHRQKPGYPDGIKETETLNVKIGRDADDEKHLCPLQMGVISRCCLLWSNPEDIILDPFSGVGSTGWKALELNRRYVGIELKKSYFDTSVNYLKQAEASSGNKTLFDLFGKDKPESETEDAPSEDEP